MHMQVIFVSLALWMYIQKPRDLKEVKVHNMGIFLVLRQELWLAPTGEVSIVVQH